MFAALGQEGEGGNGNVVSAVNVLRLGIRWGSVGRER